MYQKCDFYDCTTGLSINTFLTNITSSYSNSILFLSVANILVFSFFVFWVDRNMNLWMISLRWWELNENERIMTIILYLIIQSWICIYSKLRSMTRITYMIEPPKDQSTHQITLYSSSYSFFFSSLWVERKRVILRSKLSILLFQRHGLPFSLLILIILSPIDSIMLLILCLFLAHFILLPCFPRYVYPSFDYFERNSCWSKDDDTERFFLSDFRFDFFSIAFWSILQVFFSLFICYDE